MDVKKIVSQSKFAQVGFVVNDIEKAKKQFALLPDAGASQSSVLLRTEKIKSEKTGGVYVSFFSSQTGKCANVVSACTRLQISQKCLHF